MAAVNIQEQPPNLMQRLVPTAFAMLGSGQLQYTKAALQLLPCAERVITAHSPEMLTHFSSEIWRACRYGWTVLCKHVTMFPLL